MSIKSFYCLFILLSVDFLCINSQSRSEVDVDYYKKFLNHSNIFFNGQFLKTWANENREENTACGQDIQLWLKSFPKEKWTIEMIDSAGKIPYGLLVGNWNSMGQYLQCINLKHKDIESSRTIRGKHCYVQFPFLSFEALSDTRKYNQEFKEGGVAARLLNIGESSFVYNLGICVPHSCPAKYVEDVFQGIWSSINITQFPIKVPETTCNTAKPETWKPEEIGGVAFFACVGFIVLLSTFFDVWLQVFSKNSDAKNSYKVLRAFSMYTNSKKLTTFNADPGPLGCLHGIRALSIMWVVLGHRYTAFMMLPFENYLSILDWIPSYSAMIILAAPVAVDTFLVMSGLLLSYIFFMKQKDTKDFFKSIPMFYFHRYLRLTPVLGMVIIFYVTFAMRFVNGKNESMYEDVLKGACEKNWWVNLLYIQNYLRSDQMCVGQTWYLGVDMQLYILSPIIIYPLLRNAKVGEYLAAMWVIIAQITTFVIALINGWWGGTLVFNDPNRATYLKNFYNPFHTRATPWLLGFIVGYYLRKYLNKEKQEVNDKYITIKRVLNVVGWLASLTIMSAVLFGMKPLQEMDHKFSYSEDTLYLAFGKTAWSVALLWVIVSCFFGYGGPINWFLSLKVFQFIGRLSYSMYLIHIILQSIQITHITNILVFDHTLITYNAFGDLLSSIAVSYIMVLCFESPVLVLESILFKRKKN